MPFDQYCSNMRNDGVWGSELELQAMSRVFNVQFRILSASKPPVVIDSGAAAPTTPQRTVLLWFAHGEHFDLVIDMHRMRLLEAAQEAVFNVLKNVINRTHTRRFHLNDAFLFRNIPLLMWHRDCEARDRADTEAAVRLAQNGTLRRVEDDEALARRLQEREETRARKQLAADELLARQIAQSDERRSGERRRKGVPRQMSMSADDIHALEEEGNDDDSNNNNNNAHVVPLRPTDAAPLHPTAAPSIFDQAHNMAAAAEKAPRAKLGWFAKLRGKK